MVMSHAGVAADRNILPMLPDGALMVGGHNHLLFQHRQGRSAYVHTGSWTSAYTVADFRSDGSVTAVSRPMALDAPASPRLADLAAATLAADLTDDERTTLGVSPRALSLGDTGRHVAAGFIGHTTLGVGVPAGPVSRYAFDSIVRFDGKLMAAAVSRARFEGFMARADQDRPMLLADRNGDFLYASAMASTADLIRIVTTDWCATNQRKYFGTTDINFAEADGLRVKATAVAALLQTEFPMR